MTFQHLNSAFVGLLLYTSVFVLPTSADNTQSCEIKRLFQLSSGNLAAYEKRQIDLLGESAEGADVGYYYSADVLKAVKSVYYGETGKTELEFYFHTPLTYTSRLTDYYYSAPIYTELSLIVSKNQSDFIVCNGNLVRGIGDEIMIENFERVTDALEKLLENAPEKQTGKEGIGPP